MNELQQLKEVIGDKRTSIDKLEELRSMAEAQLDSYARAIGLLERAGPAGWTYDVWREALSAGGGGESLAPMLSSRAEWTGMFPAARERLRTQMLETLLEGQRAFTDIHQTIEAEVISRAHRTRRGRWLKIGATQ
jgi:hypothetical protein